MTVRKLGESGRNSLRADVIVYDCPWGKIANSANSGQLRHVILVAEIKRDSTGKQKGITQQLKPSLRILPRMDAMAVYWDDENRILFTKTISREGLFDEILIGTDSVANLPEFGITYRSKAITVDALTQPSNLVQLLQRLANIMRSHGVNDEQKRYKETVKLLLARYVDERKARGSDDGQLSLQVHAGADREFLPRVQRTYAEASRRYRRVRTLFTPVEGPELDEDTLRDLVYTIVID